MSRLKRSKRAALTVQPPALQTASGRYRLTKPWRENAFRPSLLLSPPATATKYRRQTADSFFQKSRTMAKVSIATRQRVVSLHQQGLSQVEISRQTGVSRCAVQALLQKHKETGRVEDQKRSGRPRKLSGADERQIKMTCLRNRKMSSSAITSELAVTSGTLVHPSTVRRSLARSGLNGRRADRKQVVPCEKSKEKRVSGAGKHGDRDDDCWQQELWTDESDLEIFDFKVEAGENHGDEGL